MKWINVKNELPHIIEPPSDTISFKRYSKLNHYGEIVEINELDDS